MKLLGLLLSELASYWFTAKKRIACIRVGHRLLCAVDGHHLCTECGRWFMRRDYWD